MTSLRRTALVAGLLGLLMGLALRFFGAPLPVGLALALGSLLGLLNLAANLLNKPPTDGLAIVPPDRLFEHFRRSCLFMGIE